ncbi:hypothetical protein FQN60_015308, partial [Etheostoma spectabile]
MIWGQRSDVVLHRMPPGLIQLNTSYVRCYNPVQFHSIAKPMLPQTGGRGTHSGDQRARDAVGLEVKEKIATQQQVVGGGSETGRRAENATPAGESSLGLSSAEVELERSQLAQQGNKMSNLRPRLCVLEKGPSGYGFHLHGEKGKTGQFIRLVEPDTPASAAGLLAGDRLVFVNGESVEGESHQQVVARIRSTTGALEVIVVDGETAELLKKHNLQCRKEFVTEGIPLPGGDSDSDRGDSKSNGTPRGSSPVPPENGDASSESSDRSGRLSVSSSTK